MQLNKETADINRQITIGLQHHQAGQLDLAESSYLSILDLEPEQSETLHLLGVLVHQRGETGRAEKLVRKAISLNSKNPFFYCSLGDIFSDRKEYEAAVRNYQKALDLKSDLVEARFNLGNALQASGQLVNAIKAYQQVLALKPALHQAHYNLANAHQRQGDVDRAKAYYHSTLDINPDFPDAYFKLGNICLEQKQFEAAIGHFQKAVALRPHWAEAFNNLGSAFQAQGISKKAISCYRKATQIKPEYAQALYNLGSIYYGQKNYDRAISCLQKAIGINSNLPDPYLLLGNSMKEKGAMAEAVSSYEKALALEPENAVAWNNLGRTLRDTGELNRALSCYQHALDLKPDYAEAFYNMGHAHQAQSEIDKALHCFQKAFDLKPHNVELINDIGLICYAQSNFADAVAWFQRAVRIDSANYNIHNNMGAAYHKLGKLAEAIGCYQTTVQLNSSDADAYNNMAVAFKDRGEIPEAIEAHRKALVHNPNYHSAHSNLLLAMHYDLNSDNHSIFSESQNWWRQHGASVEGRNIHCNRPDPGRRLNVGYVSADFRQHSVSYFFLPLLASHDRKNVNVFCYSGVSYPDRMTEKIKNFADHWRSIVGMSPEAVAEQIEADGIDILVDLAGHTAGHRLLVFARKPAPIQVTWLGYPNSTGMPVMDYRFSDAIADPPGDSDFHHSETIIRLPDGFLCYRPPEITPPVNDLPALSNGRVTFGSFNTLPKVNSRVIASWSEILMKVAGSRLFLKCKQLADESTRLSFLDKFSEHGVSPDRIKLLPQTPTTQEHLALYNDVDIGLDPFPYNGTTTTFEALWMGVPVVTFKGERHSSRVGASILTRLDLAEELIAESLQAYVDMTVALSNDIPRLRCLRNDMRHRMKNSALCDEHGFAEQVETSYRVMWHKWCEQAGKSLNSKQAAPFNSEEGMPPQGDPSDALYHAQLGDDMAESGQHREAVLYYHKAIELMPNLAEIHFNMGNSLQILGELREAVVCYENAIALNPKLFQVLLNLGKAYKNLRRLDDAIHCYKKVLFINPSGVDAYFNLGNIYLDQKENRKAICHFKKVIELNPGHADAYNNLGTAFQEQKEHDQAISFYQKALAIRPDYVAALFNLGNIYLFQKKYEQAMPRFIKVLELQPDNASVYNKLGLVKQNQGEISEAIAFYQKAIELKPDYDEAHNNIGNAHRLRGDFSKAIACYQKAIELNPDLPAAYNNMGSAYQNRDDFDAAIACHKKSIELKPDYAAAYANMGVAYLDHGRVQQAIECLQKARALEPENPGIHSKFLFALQYDPNIDPGKMLSEAQTWWRRHGEGFSGKMQYRNTQDASRRLNIGYISPDFRYHSVSWFFLPLLEAHSSSGFEIFCYSSSLNSDEMTARIRKHSDHWRSVASWSDERIAEQVRQDGIDILVDLAGHTAGNRLLVFARRPAPVQVTWLGYPDTTGMAAMDYRLTDTVADPQGLADPYYSERLVRLPHGFLCYRPPEAAPDVSPLPAKNSGSITFGSFNSLAKLDEKVISVWARIIKRVPGSRLLIKSKKLSATPTRDRLLDLFHQFGVLPEQIAMLPATPSTQAHLAQYSRVDIGLDPFPYNGTTTTCEALWMGVPVVALNGERHSCRVGSSILTQLDLEELIADCQKTYVDKAVALSADLPRLERLRHEMRSSMANSSLCDANGFAEQIETSYRVMWHKWREETQSSISNKPV